MKTEEQIQAHSLQRKRRPADRVRQNPELDIPLSRDVITIDESGLCARFFFWGAPTPVRHRKEVEPCASL